MTKTKLQTNNKCKNQNNKKMFEIFNGRNWNLFEGWNLGFEISSVKWLAQHRFFAKHKSMAGFTQHRFFAKQKNGAGFTLLEAVIYGALLTVITVVVVGGLLRLGTAYAKIQNTRKVNEVGSFALDRLSREMRRVTEDGFTVTNPSPASNSSISFKVYGTFAELVEKDGAISHWDFEELSGETFFDRISGISAVLEDENEDGVPSVLDQSQLGKTAIVGKGALFDGSDDYFVLEEAKSEAAFNSNSEGTVEAIVRFDTTDWSVIFSALNATETLNGGMLIKFGISALKTPMIFKIHFTNNSCFHAPNKIVGGTGNFYHLVFTQTDNEDPKIYVNGEEAELEEYNTNVPGCPSSAETTDTWFNTINFWANLNENENLRHVWYWIGEVKENFGLTHFNGVMDELAIYSEAINAEEIKAHYEAAFGTNTTEAVDVAREVQKTIQLSEERLQLLTTTKVSDLSSDKATVTAFSVCVIGDSSGTICDGEGVTDKRSVRIELTVSAGEGATAVEKTFVQTITARAIQE